jgi:hypothetical protein
MDLSSSWPYIESVARNRLANNKTRHHVSEYGEGIETLGVAGELLARRFLGLSEVLHEKFDGGTDFMFAGKTVDVKATVLTPNISFRYLQWPEWKPVKADIILMTAIEPVTKQGTIIGYTTREEMTKAPVNCSRFTPCHEIPVISLRPPFELVSMQLRITQGGQIWQGSKIRTRLNT